MIGCARRGLTPLVPRGSGSFTTHSYLAPELGSNSLSYGTGVRGIGEDSIELEPASLRARIGQYLGQGVDFIKYETTLHGSPLMLFSRCISGIVRHLWRGALVLRGATVVALAGVVPAAAHTQQRAPAPKSLVFDGASIIDIEAGNLLPDQRVVITGNRIQAIGPTRTTQAPVGAQVVDARGKYLIPGLWDMHVHPLDWVDVMYPLFIANGVTGIRDAASSLPLATLGQWKREIAAGVRAGPRQVVVGPALVSEKDGLAFHLSVDSPAAAARVVDSLQVAGADMIKTYVSSKDVYFAIAAAARRAGLPFGGHLPESSMGLDASDSGARFLDHEAYLGESDPCGYLRSSDLGNSLVEATACAAAARRFRRNDTWIVQTPLATQLLFPQFHYDLRRQYLPDTMLKIFDSLSGPRPPRPTSSADWAAALKRFEASRPDARRSVGVNFAPLYYAAAERAGMPTLAGTDAAPMCGWGICSSMPGFGLHDILAVFVAGGMTPLGALQSATLNPALALHATDSLGMVDAGKLADLVLLDADPLVEIWNTTKIRAVVANGRYYDRAALDVMLAQAERAAHARGP